MERIYTICMLIGFLVPLVLFLFGSVLHVLEGLDDALGGVLDGLDIGSDFSLEIGDTCVSLLPLSIHSISAALLGFGAIGKLVYRGDNLLMSVVAAGVSGYILAVLIQTLIQKLKRTEHTTYSTEQLLLFEAKVVNTIVEGGFGSICIRTPDGVSRTYPAKAADASMRIKGRTQVRILRFEKDVAIVDEVLPVNRYFAAEEQAEKLASEEEDLQVTKS